MVHRGYKQDVATLHLTKGGKAFIRWTGGHKKTRHLTGGIFRRLEAARLNNVVLICFRFALLFWWSATAHPEFIEGPGALC